MRPALRARPAPRGGPGPGDPAFPGSRAARLRGRVETLLGGGVSEAVVHRPPLGIGQHLVGFGELPEALLRLAVSGILVGMVLVRELPEGLLDLLIRRVARDAEYLVIVALHTKKTALTRPLQVRACLLSTSRCRKRNGLVRYSLTSSNSASTTSSLLFPSAVRPSPGGCWPRSVSAPCPPCDALAYMLSASLCDARARASVAVCMRPASCDSSAFFASASAPSMALRAAASSEPPCSASVFSVW